MWLSDRRGSIWIKENNGIFKLIQCSVNCIWYWPKQNFCQHHEHKVTIELTTWEDLDKHNKEVLAISWEGDFVLET